MSELASSAQLRASFLRWALVLVPGIVLLGLLSAAIAGSGPGNPWFADLVKPALYPPAATFAIVWTILYILMGLALAMIVTARGAPGRGAAIAAFAAQLVLNLAWSPLFFGMHKISIALGVLVLIDVMVAMTVWLFWRVRPHAAMLLLPCLVWVLFATALNWQFLEANPNADGGSGSSVSVDLQ
ncbi:MAG: tryptophan-rich sensory protein [Proteobacteria bacterium]|nr:tryptophan-rich sensory protein [Pseudomonadota bacterium]